MVSLGVAEKPPIASTAPCEHAPRTIDATGVLGLRYSLGNREVPWGRVARKTWGADPLKSRRKSPGPYREAERCRAKRWRSDGRSLWFLFSV
jgi:hypothetical protein